MIDLSGHLQRLARRRPLFHSEADFQLALAREIAGPDRKVRPERPIEIAGRPAVDLWIRDPDETLVVELKYVTRELEIHLGERFYLNNHAAAPQRRYDFLWDLRRAERMIPEKADRGTAILLTNEAQYWTERNVEATRTDEDFRLYGGRRIEGDLAWAPHTSEATKGGRTNDIELRGRYLAEWTDYSSLADSDSEFRYLLLEAG